MSKMLRIRQIRSAIERKENQKRTIRALGLRRMHHEVLQPDNPQIRGMIFKVKHLITVEEVEG
ncbi:MAG: 50S ribosomal protein L30 [Candidatus Eisenbacteria bacterium]|uniref:50S ribosomal protein L30 n=1 Tax=Eiseniibacteriota bacterium TaxID=2212470 RepID=A0A956LYJ9_UNCEI|nr:50S ribosomal protein L30 [Candidatus Eisenbacteria bacterium]